MNARNLLPLAALLVLLSVACNSTTVLSAQFNAEPVGSPPAFAQNVGTVQFINGAGSVTVQPSPVDGSVTNKWVRVSHPTQPTPETSLRAQFDGFHGTGKYNFLAAVFIPTGTGAVTLQFEPFGGSVSTFTDFLHLDFMPAPQNDVRVNDDNANRFGSFPRDQAFVVSVLVDSTVSPPTARISLLGGSGATGMKDVNLPSMANQFGGVRLWMGFQWTGSFFVDEILVTKQNP
jgi:hypothetical protein